MLFRFHELNKGEFFGLNTGEWYIYNITQKHDPSTKLMLRCYTAFFLSPLKLHTVWFL